MESQPPFSRANKHRNTARIRPVFSYLSKILNHYLRTVTEILHFPYVYTICGEYYARWDLSWSIRVQSYGNTLRYGLRVSSVFLLKMARGFENVCSGGSRPSLRGRPDHPESEISWGAGLKIFFRPFGPHFGRKLRGRWLPGPLP